MLVRVEADYRAGGYPLPLYNGTVKFDLNTGAEESDEEVAARARGIARRRAADRMAMSIALVTIRELRITPA